IRQKATKVTNASTTSCDWLNLPEKSSPANTKTFLIHSFGRPVLIAARSGERRGTTGSSAVLGLASVGTVGCSEVMVSTLGLEGALSGNASNGSRKGSAGCRRQRQGRGSRTGNLVPPRRRGDYGSIRTPGLRIAAGSSSAL